MKLPFVLPFCWIASLLGMEKPVVPVHLRVEQETVFVEIGGISKVYNITSK